MSEAKKSERAILSPKASRLLAKLALKLGELPRGFPEAEEQELKTRIQEHVLPLIADIQSEMLTGGGRIRLEVTAPLDDGALSVIRGTLERLSKPGLREVRRSGSTLCEVAPLGGFRYRLSFVPPLDRLSERSGTPEELLRWVQSDDEEDSPLAKRNPRRRAMRKT